MLLAYHSAIAGMDESIELVAPAAAAGGVALTTAQAVLLAAIAALVAILVVGLVSPSAKAKMQDLLAEIVASVADIVVQLTAERDAIVQQVKICKANVVNPSDECWAAMAKFFSKLADHTTAVQEWTDFVNQTVHEIPPSLANIRKIRTMLNDLKDQLKELNAIKDEVKDKCNCSNY